MKTINPSYILGLNRREKPNALAIAVCNAVTAGLRLAQHPPLTLVQRSRLALRASAMRPSLRSSSPELDLLSAERDLDGHLGVLWSLSKDPKTPAAVRVALQAFFGSRLELHVVARTYITRQRAAQRQRRRLKEAA